VTALRRRFGDLAATVDGAPEAELTLAPQKPDQVAAVLTAASEDGVTVVPWGGGTHQGFGGRVSPGLLLSTRRMDQIVDWQRRDLTIVVEAGMRVADLEQSLAGSGQTALLPEEPGEATVGGVVAAGISGWRRLRYGPTRSRVLEVVLVTGDGRVVRGGAQIVKNVAGTGVARLAIGSFGGLGVLVRVCLRLWPVPPAKATVHVGDAQEALRLLHRPLSVIEADGEAMVYLEGTEDDVAEQAASLEGEPVAGHQWPAPLSDPVQVSIRVPPALTGEAVSLLDGAAAYRAAHGVGEVIAGYGGPDVAELSRLRRWAEGVGGALVVVTAPDDLYEQFDPWGRVPDTIDIQRRLKAAFDPAGVLNAGRLSGGL
jgi:glycolate oxidase FAD binding subunit